MWPPSRSEAFTASSRLTRRAGLEAAERGQPQRLVHRLGGEAVGVGLGRGQADAVDRDRVAGRDLGAEARSRCAAWRPSLPALDRLDRADVLDQPGEHPHHSLNRV